MRGMRLAKTGQTVETWVKRIDNGEWLHVVIIKDDEGVKLYHDGAVFGAREPGDEVIGKEGGSVYGEEKSGEEKSS